MTWNFRLYFHIATLYNGRRSFYGALDMGQRTWWVQRWDSVRCDDLKARWRHDNPKTQMTWALGSR